MRSCDRESTLLKYFTENVTLLIWKHSTLDSHRCCGHFRFQRMFELWQSIQIMTNRVHTAGQTTLFKMYLQETKTGLFKRCSAINCELIKTKAITILFDSNINYTSHTAQHLPKTNHEHYYMTALCLQNLHITAQHSAHISVHRPVASNTAPTSTSNLSVQWR
jgi:hypothetical protein